MFGNEYHKWEKLALWKAIALYGEKKYDIILSSYAPESTHRVALKLKKRFSDVKWIADMRDEMSKNPFIPSLKRRRLEILEKEILKHCNALVSVSAPILEEFRNSVKERRNIYFCEVRNGFDFDLELNRKRENVRKFIVSYVGNFYGRRNPRNFFRALVDLDNEILKKMEVKFVGLTKPVLVPNKLKNIVELIPKVPHEEAISFMRNSDALLLIHPKGRKGVYTGKLFEYLGVLRPIMALVDKEDVAAELIREANAGYIADFDDVDEIRNIIIKAYKDWERGITPDFNIEVIRKHHRKKQVGKLESLIERLVCV